MENQLLRRTFDRQPINVNYMSFGSFNSAHTKYYHNCHPIKSIKYRKYDRNLKAIYNLFISSMAPSMMQDNITFFISLLFAAIFLFKK